MQPDETFAGPLGRSARKACDSVGGAWIAILWPTAWPTGPYEDLPPVNRFSSTDRRSWRALPRAIHAGPVSNGLHRDGLLWLPDDPGWSRELVPVRSGAVLLRRHGGHKVAGDTTALHLVVHLIGHRWVNARQSTPGQRVTILDRPPPDWPAA